MELTSGTQVGQYRIRGKLGEGGMSTVYLAEHVALGSLHALKVLSQDLVGSEQQRRRLHTEGQIQANLQHPNIVPVTDIVSKPGVAGLVMAYIEGPTLETWMRDHPAMAWTDAVTFILDVLEGVAAAHEKGIVHRDLKPSNVLLARQRSGALQAKVSDFGIAKRSDGERRSKTKTGTRLGTIEYMSPEQTRGASDVDARTDVWAVGTILYEMLAGRAPFQAPSDYETMRSIVSGERADLRPIRRDVPEAVHRVIDQALAVDRAQRFPDCGALSRALRQAVHAPAPPNAPGPKPRPRPALPTDVPTPGSGRSAPPNSKRLSALGIAFSLVAAAGVVAFVNSERPTPPPPPPPPPPSPTLTTAPSPPPWWDALYATTCPKPCAAGKACDSAKLARCASGITCLPGALSDPFADDEALELHLSYLVEIGATSDPCKTTNDYWVCRRGTNACVGQREACQAGNRNGVLGAKSPGSLTVMGAELDGKTVVFEIREGGPSGQVVQTTPPIVTLSRGVLCKGYGMDLRQAPSPGAVAENIVFWVDHG